MKRLEGAHRGIAALVLAMSLVAATLPAPRTAEAAIGVVLYDGVNQSGNSLSFDATDAVPDLALLGFDNVASSISIAIGRWVSLYSEPNFGGDCVNTRGSVNDLTTLGLNDNDVSSIRFNQACSGPPATYARLHHHATSYTTGVNVYRDVPDLGVLGADNVASAITLHGLHAVALYNGANYTGRCETIIPRNTGSLVGTTIGNDRVSSIRLYFTCLGPVRQAPAITAIKFLNNSSDVTDCGSTYTRRQKDLNDNAGGNYIYLCIQYGPFRAGNAALTDFTVLVSPSSVSTIPGCLTSIDLNDDAGGAWVYPCPTWRTSSERESFSALRDIDFIWFDDIGDALAANLINECSWEMGGPANAVDSNLNDGAGGDYIYACTLAHSSLQDSFDPYLVLPEDLTAWESGDPDGTEVDYEVYGYDYLGNSVIYACSPAERYIFSWRTLAPFGPTTVECSVTDSSGRETSGSFQINIVPPPDLTAPVISATATSGGSPYIAGTWVSQPVTVTFTCVDEVDGSGVASVTGPITISTQGENQSALGTCQDVAGNSVSTTFSGINIDLSAPTISLASRTPANGAGWNNTDVTVVWICADSLSGVLSATVSATITDEGTNQSAVGTCEDLVGNTASATETGIDIDKTPPTILLVSRTLANSAGWNNTDVSLQWNCSDGLSGAVSPAIFETVSAEGAGQTAVGQCEDNADNTALDTQENINIDKTAPLPDVGGPYVVDEGSEIQLDGSGSTDALSGVAARAWAVDGDDQFDDGDPATFSGVDGPAVHTVKLRVEDVAGNAASAETDVTVNNVAPSIVALTTNSPVPQGQPALIDVDAFDPGVNDILTYRFDCDNDGSYETHGVGNHGSCDLDPAVFITTIGVQVSDEDGGQVTTSVDIQQVVMLCASLMTGALYTQQPGGGCASGTLQLTLPTLAPTVLCANIYTRGLSWAPGGSCPDGRRIQIVPTNGPLPYCASMWTGKLQSKHPTQDCSAYEWAGIIPGHVR